MEFTTSASRRQRYTSAISLFDPGLELCTGRIGSLELSRVQSGDPRLCSAGVVWHCTPHTPRAAIARPLRAAGERSGGRNRDLWAVHPLQTESVTYVIQRMESLMGLFLLLTLYCVIRGHDSPRRLWWFAGAVACCALGTATKEGMATAPIIVLFYDRVFLADSWADLWHKRSRLYIGLAATWLILITLIVINKARGGTLLGFPAVSWWRYAQNQFGAAAHYLRLALWPDSLCIDYGWQTSTLPGSWIAVGVMLAVCLLAATRWALANAPPLGFLSAWFILTLAPSSSLVPIRDMVAEHRMYLPLAAMVTLAVLAAWIGLAALSRRLATHELRVDGLALR